MLRFTKILVAGTGVLGLASCLTNYPALRVTAEGNLQHGVAFYFSDSYRQHPPPFEVRRLEVSERLSNGNDMVIWEINGKQGLRWIAYGVKYLGLEQVRSASPLQRGKRYSVYIDSNGGFELIGFLIDEAGRVVQVPWR